MIQGAMQEWMDKTCIVFAEKGSAKAAAAGRLIAAAGRLIAAAGRLIAAAGRLIAAAGRLIVWLGSR